ncbi:MAG: hypothetical protein SPD11_10200 [Sphaerochaetaceae bacterium]|nr:hypothetical protein [Sphaerochaetaceae bacterium]
MKRYIFFTALPLLVLLTATSCVSTSAVDLSQVDLLYLQGDVESAKTHYEEKTKEILSAQGQLVYSLDLGMLSHYTGAYSASNEFLTAAEGLISDAYTESVMANIGSYILNDNTRVYPGEDYEDIYANVFKSLNYHFLGKTEDSMVEIRRTSEKESLLKDKYARLLEKSEQASEGRLTGGLQSISFSQSALANYLGMLYSGALGNTSDRDYYLRSVQNAFSMQPTLYQFSLPPSAQKRPEPEQGKIRLEFIAFTGLGPTKQEVVQQLYVSKNNYAKLALPVMSLRPEQVTRIAVRLDTGQKVQLYKIEDLSRIAQDTFALRYQNIYNKTLLRTLTKATGTVVFDAVEHEARKSDKEGSDSVALVSGFLSLFSSIFNQVSEQADLRISHYFPATAWVGYLDVEPGDYTATFYYADATSILYSEQEMVSPREGQLNLYEGFCPM